ncbi:hypothetical protein D0Y65_005822 [Glycine soja]|uniref:Uncharacterized protein n=1 Tax=Glycine soja TaxID=3848 RepID=A0A445L697_GLYSO|nr:hypothetical protein D0Y65_005822 [Glycine soja]
MLSEPCEKISHHTAHQLDLPLEPYVQTDLEKQWGERDAAAIGVGPVTIRHKSPLATHMPCCNCNLQYVMEVLNSLGNRKVKGEHLVLEN